MGLAELQHGLAQLYTNAGLRERFLADPLAVGGELGLSADEARQLAQLSAPQLRSFADSLHNKRLNEIGKLLPLTSRVMGRRFADLFVRYAETHTPAGVQKHLGDALAFAEYVVNAALVERLEPPWLLDLVRYEKARLVAADPRRRFVACFFNHHIGPLVRSLARRSETPAVTPRPTLAVWVRPRRHGIVRYAAWMLPGIFRRLGKKGIDAADT